MDGRQRPERPIKFPNALADRRPVEHWSAGLRCKNFFWVPGIGGPERSVQFRATIAIFTNNYVHHTGTFPWSSSQDATAGGQGISLQYCSNVIVVSNIIADCNYNAIGGSGGTCTNLIFWGNELYNIQDHGIQTWARGFTLIANNYIHDVTNGA